MRCEPTPVYLCHIYDAWKLSLIFAQHVTVFVSVHVIVFVSVHLFVICVHLFVICVHLFIYLINSGINHVLLHCLYFCCVLIMVSLFAQQLGSAEGCLHGGRCRFSSPRAPVGVREKDLEASRRRAIACSSAIT